mmetsp:Transcript_53434/g.85363  ORF Transcript_53434/g.85363 Transcript_53434/m.85363 type:complete len:446 (-) Transcript_53434:103-1440(-)
MKKCIIFASLLAAINGQGTNDAAVVSQQALPSFVGTFLTAPEMLSCSANDTATCDAIGFACMEMVCTPSCTEAANCTDFGSGTGLNACSPDGACYFDPAGTCTSDDDCPSVIGFTCDTTDGSCVQPDGCLNDDDCTSPGLGKCTPDPANAGVGLCVQEDCAETADCISDGYVCAPFGYCVPGCVGNEVLCTDQAFVCDADSGLCTLGCTLDEDCSGFTNACVSGTCQPTCVADADCTDLGIPGATCNTDAGLCVPSQTTLPQDTRCDTDADCSQLTLTPDCNTQTNTCYPGCTTSSECQDEYGLPDTFVCKTEDGVKTCAPDENVGGSCSSDSGCEDGYRCIPPIGTGVCVPQCDTDDDCTALGFNSPCVSTTFGTSPLTVTVKYCNLAEALSTTSTEAPVETTEDEGDMGTTGTTDDDEDPGDAANYIALWSVCAAVIVSYLFV